MTKMSKNWRQGIFQIFIFFMVDGCRRPIELWNQSIILTFYAGSDFSGPKVQKQPKNGNIEKSGLWPQNSKSAKFKKHFITSFGALMAPRPLGGSLGARAPPVVANIEFCGHRAVCHSHNKGINGRPPYQNYIGDSYRILI